jgi:hypothetical protein
MSTPLRSMALRIMFLTRYAHVLALDHIADYVSDQLRSRPLPSIAFQNIGTWKFWQAGGVADEGDSSTSPNHNPNFTDYSGHHIKILNRNPGRQMVAPMREAAAKALAAALTLPTILDTKSKP